jgi:polyhydroxyalkanoate synthesis regulator phasin
MTIPQLTIENVGRARWLKIAAAAWLLLVSALAVVNSVGLSRLTEQSQASAHDAHVQALNTRVAELEQQAAATKGQPKPVAQPDFEAARKAMDERLAQVEQAQAANAHAGDLQALQARVGDIEARMKRSAAPAVAPRRTTEPAKPKAPEPSFNVVGVELRGGERFLSVAAPKASSVLDVWLLREGDAVGAWHLLAIEARAAVFRVDGQTQRIALP